MFTPRKILTRFYTVGPCWDLVGPSAQIPTVDQLCEAFPEGVVIAYFSKDEGFDDERMVTFVDENGASWSFRSRWGCLWVGVVPYNLTRDTYEETACKLIRFVCERVKANVQGSGNG